VKWPRAAEPILASAKLEVRVLVVVYNFIRKVLGAAGSCVGSWCSRVGSALS